MAKRCYSCMKLKEKSPICEHCGYNENVPNYPHQLPIGTVLRDQYVVGKVLGQGGFGITYIGWDNSLDAAVAIKEFYPSSFVNRDCNQTLRVSCNGEAAEELFRHNRERFLREARILAKLSNVPGIVRVQNLFSENNTAYIVMEYVEGIDLKRYIRMQNRVLTVEETLSVLRPVMYALSKVHDAELVHRDISPDNIMIQKDGQAKLLDFGAAREVENADVNMELPQSTEAILKHGFAPMEQYRRRGSLGPWTDVYAMCATMYYCLTGKVPNSAPERILGDDNVDWKQIPGLTEAQIAVLQKGLELVPEKRLHTIRDLQLGLFGQTGTGFTGFTGEGTEPTSEAKPSNYPSHTLPLEETPASVHPVAAPKSKKKLPIVLIASAILAVAALAVLFTVKPEEPQPPILVPEATEISGDSFVLPTFVPAVEETTVPEETTLAEVELTSPVMLDSDGIYVEFRGVEKHSSHSYVINLYIENNQDTDFFLSLRNTRLNDYVIEVSNNGITIPANSKYLTLPQFDLVVSTDKLTECGITSIDSIRTTLEILTERSGNVICEAPVSLTINNANETEDSSEKTEPGTVLVDTEDFYIAFRGIVEHSSSSMILNLYVENKRDSEIFLKLNNNRVNSFTLDLSNNGNSIPANSKYLASPSFDFIISVNKLNACGITSIEDLDFDLEIRTDRNGTLLYSDSIHVDVE